jgi:hypothetical protein
VDSHEEARMRRTATLFALASTLGLLACSDSPTNPSAPTGGPNVPPDVELPAADPPGFMRVSGLAWFLSDLPPHWVYYWSGGAARRLTVSRISEPANVVWEIVDVSGDGICANARVVNGHCAGGALMHGQVPVGARATVEVDPVLVLTPHPPAVRYRLSVILMDEREGSFEFSTHFPCTSDSPPRPNYSCQ